ncbi:non-hydrolyzing UDP-N-acetylglucosamine 2-epimerase [Taibaiella koreensis]|uniref:non-hydrolyzing UDP-N-acetylglucosamine 2-epimerase n=1 Tax=Taibaiella koreensis TaxID=1268548 RepID=UPI000E59C3A8|nr:UDP-N-acetylglucosamine 2-epimerase (non-hydrolyzing) [Taibaiella koreensis]
MLTAPTSYPRKVLLVFGTRPEAIKMAPLYLELSKHPDEIEVAVCLTAQHREMLDQVIRFFGIPARYDLNLMKPGQNLHNLTAAIIEGMKPVLEDFRPDYVFVHGDTTTSMAAALAAFYSGAKVGHVEAGLRTFNKQSPFPEEMNRSITGRIADIHFAPTQQSRENLLREDIAEQHIVVTGNTVIDALQHGLRLIEEAEPESVRLLKQQLPMHRDVILVTGHRRENFGEGFLSICRALKRIAEHADAEIVYPVHLNPNVQGPVYELLSDVSNIHLIDPQPYESFIWLMNKSRLIITDSGGVQEEAPSLGKPVLVMRDTTERPEAVSAGTVILVGTDENRIVKETLDLLYDTERYDRMARLHNPYGDGKATKRIAQFLLTNHKHEYVS